MHILSDINNNNNNDSSVNLLQCFIILEKNDCILLLGCSELLFDCFFSCLVDKKKMPSKTT